MTGDIKIGDVLFLKSGGQPMTVHGVEIHQEGLAEAGPVVILIWHDNTGGLQTAKVHPGILERDD